LIRGLAHEFVAQRDARRDISHIFMHPPFARDWLQPHWHPAGTVRRSIPGVSATEPTAAVNASPSASAQCSEKGTALAILTLPNMKTVSSQLGKKPMDHPAK
jgi:hypothetical protein